MRHDLTLDGLAFRLRPVSSADAAFIHELRTYERAAGRLHEVSGGIDGQASWLASYFERPGDWYWIVERRRDRVPEGAVGLYDYDAARSTAEWGRWILVPGSLAAPESALLVYEAAFDRLGLQGVRCRTVATNLAVVSFHDRSGLARAGVVSNAFELGGVQVDAVEHRLDRAAWPRTRELLSVRAAQAAELLNRATP